MFFYVFTFPNHYFYNSQPYTTIQKKWTYKKRKETKKLKKTTKTKITQSVKTKNDHFIYRPQKNNCTNAKNKTKHYITYDIPKSPIKQAY